MLWLNHHVIRLFPRVLLIQSDNKVLLNCPINQIYWVILKNKVEKTELYGNFILLTYTKKCEWIKLIINHYIFIAMTIFMSVILQ